MIIKDLKIVLSKFGERSLCLKVVFFFFKNLKIVENTSGWFSMSQELMINSETFLLMSNV